MDIRKYFNIPIHESFVKDDESNKDESKNDNNGESEGQRQVHKVFTDGSTFKARKHVTRRTKRIR